MLVLAHASARVSSVFTIPRTALRPSHANGCTPNADSALLDVRGRSGQSIPSSESVSEGDVRHSACSRSSTRCGAIIPVAGVHLTLYPQNLESVVQPVPNYCCAGFLPGPFVLACVLWTLGAIRYVTTSHAALYITSATTGNSTYLCRFWRRFDRTSYMRNSRLALTALWPLLFIGSPKFRSEFKKAVTSARDGIP